MRSLIRSKLAAAVLGALSLAPTLAHSQSDNPLLQTFSMRGPFETMTIDMPDFRLYVPQSLGRDGRQHGVMIWGNGTNGNIVTYFSLLDQVASHGFVVAAAATPNAGSGREMIAAGEFVLRAAVDPQSPFFGNINTRGICASGHSQGARGAVAAANLSSDVTCTIPLETSNAPVDTLRVPTAFLYGSLDDIAMPQEGQVLANRILTRGDQGPQLIFGIVNGATHFTPVTRRAPVSELTSIMAGYLTAFLKANLEQGPDADQAATLFFGPERACGICRDNRIQGLIRNFPDTTRNPAVGPVGR